MEAPSPSRSHLRWLWFAARLALVAALVWFYYAGAAEHARTVNVSRVRADQSGYLWDAVAVYRNWHRLNVPPQLVGERNRMPLYPGLLALFYDPRLSPDEFFEVGKRVNIQLSLVLLALLAVLFRRHLPPLVSTNLILVTAFGYFVFRAGYTQAELLFGFLFFVTFLTCCYLLKRRDPAPSLGLGLLAGLLAALSHLTKAAMLPFMAVFLAVYGLRELWLLRRGMALQEARIRRTALARFSWRVVAAAVLLVSFFGVLSPYLSNSKRVFGRYFYNVNTTFYVWYDDWPQASVGTYRHGDGVGWPRMPRKEIPSFRSYLRSHTAKQIAARLGDGFAEMVTVSYRFHWYMKFVALYVVFALLLIAKNRQPFARVIRDNLAIFVFLSLYAAVYLLGIAFYKPTGTTTSRFLLPHLAPLLFVLSSLFVRAPFSRTEWHPAGVTITSAHVHLLVLATIGMDVVFTVWSRLMSLYSGF
jgi:hypothetical protein